VKIVSKHIGKNKCFEELSKLAENRNNSFPLFIGYSDCKDMMMKLIEKENEFSLLDGKTRFFEIGAAIGTHAGPGAIAFAFIKK
jgi:fatty acid-binding protein DegV